MIQKQSPVTAIVLTYNESINIERCLKAMRQIDDVVIVDSHSSDDTLDRARCARCDVRIYSNAFKDFGDQRNWALDNTEPKHDWVLFVDADEYCTPELIDELERFLRTSPPYVGGYLAGKNFFLGRWLKHSTMYPSYQLRLLKLGAVRFRKEGHGQREVTSGPICYLREGWIHNMFSKGLHEWIHRHNTYSTAEVEALRKLRSEPLLLRDLCNRDPVTRRRAVKLLSSKAPGRPLLRFIYAYLIRGGLRDGYPGLLYCGLLFAHAIHLSAKMKELDYNRSARGQRQDRRNAG